MVLRFTRTRRVRVMHCHPVLPRSWTPRWTLLPQMRHGLSGKAAFFGQAVPILRLAVQTAGVGQKRRAAWGSSAPKGENDGRRERDGRTSGRWPGRKGDLARPGSLRSLKWVRCGRCATCPLGSCPQGQVRWSFRSPARSLPRPAFQSARLRGRWRSRAQDRGPVGAGRHRQDSRPASRDARSGRFR